MKNIIKTVAVYCGALLLTAPGLAFAGGFEELRAGSALPLTGAESIVGELKTMEHPHLSLPDARKIAFTVPEGMEACIFSGVKENKCVFKCDSGATVTRPKLNSSLAQNGGCARVVIVPAQSKSAEKQNPPQAYANGKLYEYNSGTKKYDIDLNTKCSASVVNLKSYIDNDHGSPEETISANYKLAGFPAVTAKYLNGKAEGLSPNEDFRVVSLADYYKESGYTSGVRVNITLNEAVSTQNFFSKPISITRVRVTFENSATGYFGGEAIKWGYMCEIR